MEIRQLQYFLLAARSKSFNKAAQTAYITPQAIAKSINSLEDELGVNLFVRTHQGVFLTAAGKVLVNRAMDILTLINSSILQVKACSQKEENLVQIAFGSGLENYLPLEPITDYESNHQNLKISTLSGTDKEIENWLNNKLIDFGIIGSYGNSPEIDYTPLYQANTFLAVNSANELSQKDTVSILDLKDQRLLTGSLEYYATLNLVEICNLAGFTPNIVHQTDNTEFFIKLVSKNMGVFLCPSDSYSSFQKNKNIVLIPFQDDPHIYQVHLVTHKDHQLSLLVQNLIQELLQIWLPASAK